MKTIRVVFLLFFVALQFLTVSNYAKPSYYKNSEAGSGSKAIFSPDKPKHGDKIKVIFMPGEKSPVIGLDSLYMDVMFIYKDGGSITEEYLMNKNGSFWTTEFVLTNEEAAAMAIQFASTSFSKVDCNDEKAWDLLVYGNDGNPVKGAYSAYARGYLVISPFQRMQDMNKYADGMKKEFERFPDDPINLINTWFLRRMPSEQVKVKRETDSLFQKFPDNIKLLEAIYSQYVTTKDAVNENKVLKRIKELDPKNPAAIYAERGKIFFNKADKNKLEKFYQLVKESEGTKAFDILQRDYFQNLIRAKYYERAVDFLKEWEKPDWREIISASSRIAYDYSRINKYSPNFELSTRLPLKEEDGKQKNIIRIAISMAKFGIKGYQNAKVTERDRYEIPSGWYSQRKNSLGLANFSLGFAFQSIQQNDSALAYYEKAKRILGNDFYSNPDQSYYSLLLSLNKKAQAFEEAKKALNLASYYKDMFIKVLRNAADTPEKEKEAEEIIKKHKTNFAETREKEIASNFLTKPESAKDFRLSELNGSLVSLSALKRKIVILEFWDTYCGWCLKSFEKLQPFYEKHKNDTSFVFLTINTNPPSDAKESNIKDYMKEHKFTFPVLLDPENKVVSAYKLFGTPQTLVINRGGEIVYKESGYGGPTIAEDLERIVEKVK
ncbi:MAG: TlpA disulfide reductase family protein [Melioribacteraceae bacterium]